MFRKKEGDKAMSGEIAEESVAEESVEGTPEIMVESEIESTPEGESTSTEEDPTIESVSVTEEQAIVSEGESVIEPVIIENIEVAGIVEAPIPSTYIPTTPENETWSVAADEIVKEETEGAPINTEKEIQTMSETELTVQTIDGTPGLYTPGDGHLEIPKLDTDHSTRISVVSAQLPFGKVTVEVNEQVACAWILKNVLGPLMGDVDKNQP